MKKKVIKPFELRAYYKNGTKIQTRDGHKVRIVCTNAKNKKFPIIALIETDDGEETTMFFTIEGKNNEKYISNYDLVIVEEVEVIEDFWSDKEKVDIEGYGISIDSITNCFIKRTVDGYGLFKTEKQAKSALAMAKISQIMANDIENFGGVVTDEEWADISNWKYVIFRSCNKSNRIGVTAGYCDYHFLAFHTAAQRDLFLKKYRDLVSDYFMLD